jgi:hypothetical protein
LGSGFLFHRWSFGYRLTINEPRGPARIVYPLVAVLVIATILPFEDEEENEDENDFVLIGG